MFVLLGYDYEEQCKTRIDCQPVDELKSSDCVINVKEIFLFLFEFSMQDTTSALGLLFVFIVMSVILYSSVTVKVYCLIDLKLLFG
jgi:hypothetical protein